MKNSKYSKKTSRKKVAGKYKPYYEKIPNYVVAVRTPGIGFPDTLRTSLSYTDTFSIKSTAFQTIYSFRGNSCYDPDFSSTGHQPAYFDTYSEVYSRYKVYGSSINVAFANSTNDLSLLAIIPNSVNLGVGSAPSAMLDLPRARWRTVGAANIMTSSLSHSASTNEVLGLTSRQIEDDDYSAVTSSNPAQLWYWNLYATKVDTTNLNVDIVVVVRIVYDVKFFDKIFITPSYKTNHPSQTQIPSSQNSLTERVSRAQQGR